MCITEFEYKGTKTLIQCNPNDKMKNICENFTKKLSIDMNSIYFLYSSNQLNYELTFIQTANNIDKIRNQISVLVYSNDNNKGPDKIISKNIICPKCGENSKFKLNDYKVCLYGCKNKHKINNIPLDEYENTQDISNIVCDICKDATISQAYQNVFYACLDCQNNICILCKKKHDKKHFIIDFEQKNYFCSIHKEHYYSYCQNCKQNLCTLCENGHKKHKIIYFGSIIPDNNDKKIKIKLEELRATIDNFEKNIKGIIDILNKVVQGIKIYYDINNNCLYRNKF